MLTLLLGLDDFSKKQHLLKLSNGQSLPEDVYFDEASVPALEVLAGADLFASAKRHIFYFFPPGFSEPDVTAKLAKSRNQIIIITEKLDKRVGDNKKLLANKDVVTVDFVLPHGKQLDAWLVSRAGELGAKLSSVAADALARALGRDEAIETKFGGRVTEVKELFSLWQADSELRKLIAHAAGREITVQDVESLVVKNENADVFDLTNAIADGKKYDALFLTHKLLGLQTGAEEKTAIIQLNALLAEQFRSLAALQDFLHNKKTEEEILDFTGWKPGRLFMMKKAAQKFSTSKVLDFLNKLKALDEELKSTSTPAKVLLDLIIVQLF